MRHQKNGFFFSTVWFNFHICIEKRVTWTFYKTNHFVCQRRKKIYSFGATSEWVNEGNIFISGWSNPLTPWKCLFKPQRETKLCQLLWIMKNICPILHFGSKNSHTLTVPLRQDQFTRFHNYIIHNHVGTAGLQSFT